MRTCVWKDNESFWTKRFVQAMFDKQLTLASGDRVRVRLPHASDRAGVEALHARLGHERAGELGVARALRFDPRTHLVLCATAWTGNAQALVGYGAIEHGAVAPHLLVCDDTEAPGLRAALHQALVRATARSRAA